MERVLLRLLGVWMVAWGMPLGLWGQADSAACRVAVPCDAVVVRHAFTADAETTPVDTHLAHFYATTPFAAAVPFAALAGTWGRPALPLSRTFAPAAEGDFLYHNPYALYQASPATLEVIRSGVPYAEWYYMLGAHREQVFRATHALNAGKALNAGLDLKFINNQGAYQHQHAKTSYLALYAQYHDSRLPVESDLQVFFNGINHQENGGIKDASYFEDTSKINRELVPVWLTYARNTHGSASLVWDTRWYPGHDSPPVSATTGSNPHFRHHLSLTLSAQRQHFEYYDTDPFNPWYPTTRYDTTVTFDSVFSSTFTAALGYHLALGSGLTATLGVAVSPYRYWDTLSNGGSGSALSPSTRWQLRLAPGLTLRADASARFDQTLGNTHSLLTSLRWNPRPPLSVVLHVNNWSSLPYRQDLAYASNHFIWQGTMVNQHFTQAATTLALTGRVPLSLAATATRITGLIYYTQQALPNQFPGTVYLYQMLLSTEVSAGRFRCQGSLALQHSPDENHLLRQPLLLAEVMTGLQFALFRGKIDALAGVVTHARSSHYADEWMPVTRVFHHTTLPALQSYAWADPFVTFVLKKTRIMLRYEHASAWLAGFGYYSLPGYPMGDPSLRFAVAWRFME